MAFYPNRNSRTNLVLGGNSSAVAACCQNDTTFDRVYVSLDMMHLLGCNFSRVRLRIFRVRKPRPVVGVLSMKWVPSLQKGPVTRAWVFRMTVGRVVFR